MSILIWTMVGLAIWHFAVLIPDRFAGGIVGALLAAVAGGILSGYALPTPGIPTANPPGVQETVWAIPGSIVFLLASWIIGSPRERAAEERAAEQVAATPRSHQ